MLSSMTVIVHIISCKMFLTEADVCATFNFTVVYLRPIHQDVVYECMSKFFWISEYSIFLTSLLLHISLYSSQLRTKMADSCELLPLTTILQSSHGNFALKMTDRDVLNTNLYFHSGVFPS